MTTKYYGDKIREVVVFKETEFDETDEMMVSYKIRAGEFVMDFLSLEDVKLLHEVLGRAIEEGGAE